MVETCEIVAGNWIRCSSGSQASNGTQMLPDINILKTKSNLVLYQESVRTEL
jgi:hypothetical protein